MFIEQQPRDPRFLPLAGEFSQEKFQSHYGFLMDAHKTELRTLRDNLKAARKLLASSPRDLRPEREAEVSRLERAVKRAESLVNQDRKARVDQEALTKLDEAERAKRKEGKAGWWMKECLCSINGNCLIDLSSSQRIRRNFCCERGTMPWRLKVGSVR
jgi:ribosomal RNA-processing protein 36